MFREYDQFPHPTRNAPTPCGPWVCDYPRAAGVPAGTRWRCPRCSTHYRMSRPKPDRWWRRHSYAPNGEWMLTWPDRLRRG